MYEWKNLMLRGPNEGERVSSRDCLENMMETVISEKILKD